MEAVAERLKRIGAELAESVAFDALAPEDHEQIVDHVFARYGEIDAVLLAFGLYGDKQLWETDGGAARQVVETNFAGAVSAAIPIVRHLRAQGHGVLVVLSSVAAQRARQSEYLYAASKAGLDIFFQGLREGLCGSGVRVLLVRPGFVVTKMNEGRQAKPWAVKPEAVAESIVQGLERHADTIWVPSFLRWAMLIMQHLPASIFRRMTAMARRRGLD